MRQLHASRAIVYVTREIEFFYREIVLCSPSDIFYFNNLAINSIGKAHENGNVSVVAIPV